MKLENRFQGSCEIHNNGDSGFDIKHWRCVMHSMNDAVDKSKALTDSFKHKAY